jgi:1,4-alpha-glucan branching enzyme
MRLERKQRQTFSIEAPAAKEVMLAGEFTDWEQHPVPLKRGKNGRWSATVQLAPGSYEYRFLIDGLWCDDPACGSRVPNNYGSSNCVCTVVPAAVKQS